MTDWEILGIEPVSDQRLVKRAYARKLKIIRPDENPKGFQQLHEAYQSILSCIDNELDFAEIKPNSIGERKEYSGKDIDVENEHYRDKNSDNANNENSNANILDKVEFCLKTGDNECWMDLVKNDKLTTIQFRNEVSFEVFEKLIDYATTGKLLPIDNDIGKQLLDLFLWDQQELELCKYFPSNDVGKVLTLLGRNSEVINRKYIPPAMNDYEQEKSMNPYIFILFVLISLIILVIIGMRA